MSPEPPAPFPRRPFQRSPPRLGARGKRRLPSSAGRAARGCSRPARQGAGRGRVGVATAPPARGVAAGRRRLWLPAGRPPPQRAICKEKKGAILGVAACSREQPGPRPRAAPRRSCPGSRPCPPSQARDHGRTPPPRPRAPGPSTRPGPALPDTADRPTPPAAPRTHLPKLDPGVRLRAEESRNGRGRGSARPGASSVRGAGRPIPPAGVLPTERRVHRSAPGRRASGGGGGCGSSSPPPPPSPPPLPRAVRLRGGAGAILGARVRSLPQVFLLDLVNGVTGRVRERRQSPRSGFPKHPWGFPCAVPSGNRKRISPAENTWALPPSCPSLRRKQTGVRAWARRLT